jgi:lipoprotein-anchoring transpeptidase ErfK/SrfK
VLRDPQPERPQRQERVQQEPEEEAPQRRVRQAEPVQPREREAEPAEAPVQEAAPAEAPVRQAEPAAGPKPYTPPKRAKAAAEEPADEDAEEQADDADGGDDATEQAASPEGDPALAETPAGQAETQGQDQGQGEPAAQATADPTPSTGGQRSLASLDVDEVNAATFQENAKAIKGPSPLILKAQILLDRAGASPGVIDGVYGGNVGKAIAAVETVLGLPVDGQLDGNVWTALGGDQASDVLVEYTITEEDANYPFLPSIPRDYAEQAQLSALGFTSPQEMFGERFHMDAKLVDALNPGANFRQAGETIVVAAIEGQPVTGKIARIEADKGRRQVRAYDAQQRLIVAYPATIGSSDNPSPSGDHAVNTVAPNPIYYYNPKNFVQGNNTKKLELPPGPNNPVGTMWIDLTEPSYGIHGTPEPSKIDKTGSHGCIRLTNWDAEELATLVDPGVVVSFLE